MRDVQWITYALIVLALFTIDGCATRPVETEITGQTVSCEDGAHQVLNCQSIFAQYKRNFEAGLKLLDAIGTKISLPVQPLMALDSLTGDLMLYRQSLCRNYNNCLISKSEYLEEERKLTQLQLDLRRAVALGQQGIMVETSTTVTSDASGVNLGNAEPAPMETAAVEEKGVSGEYNSKNVAGKIAEVLGVIKRDIVKTRGLQINQDPAAAGGTGVAAKPNASSTRQHATLSDGVTQQVDTLVSQLTQQLQQNAPNKVGARLVIGSINSRDHEYETPFAHYLASLLKKRMQNSGAVQVVPPQQLRGIGIRDDPKQPSTLAKRAGADLVLYGTQADTPTGVQIQLALSERPAAQPLATAKAIFAKDQIPADHPAQTGNISSVRENQRVLTQLGDKRSGQLKVDIWTDHGGSSATYYEGEEIHVLLRANQDCHLRLFYLDASGNTIQLFPNLRESNDKLQANQETEIPSNDASYKFSVQAPFGTEQLVAIASLIPIPETEGMDTGDGRKIMANAAAGIVETVEKTQDASRTRGVEEDPNIAWDTILLTTLPRPTSSS